MPALFIFAIFAFVVLAVCVLITVATRKDKESAAFAGGAIVGVLALIAGALSLIFSSFNAVGTYDIGVTTSFGRVMSYVGPGPHWIAPWQNMSLMDESVQTTDYASVVRLAQQQTANATVHLRWRVVPTATDNLFKLYKGSTKNVETGLVQPKLNEAINTVLGGYNPITPLSTHAAEGTPGNPTTAQLSQQITSALNAEIGSQVQIVSLVLKPLDYDQEVDNRINSVISQTAQTDKAAEAVKTAQEQAAAYEKVAAELKANPLVLAKECMDAIADGQFQPPAGFSCYQGGGSSVVIPSSK